MNTSIKPENLIPGHVYKERTGIELVFVGFGTYKRYANYTNAYDWGYPGPKFLYAKKTDILTKLTDGRLSKDLSVFNGHATGKTGLVPDFFRTVFFSDKPRVVIEDLGELFPMETFSHWTVNDITVEKDIYWTIRAGKFNHA